MGWTGPRPISGPDRERYCEGRAQGSPADCNTGTVDGNWNAASQKALDLFNRHAGMKLDVKTALTRSMPSRVRPAASVLWFANTVLRPTVAGAQRSPVVQATKLAMTTPARKSRWRGRQRNAKSQTRNANHRTVRSWMQPPQNHKHRDRSLVVRGVPSRSEGVGWKYGPHGCVGRVGVKSATNAATDFARSRWHLSAWRSLSHSTAHHTASNVPQIGPTGSTPVPVQFPAYKKGLRATERALWGFGRKTDANCFPEAIGCRGHWGRLQSLSGKSPPCCGSPGLRAQGLRRIIRCFRLGSTAK